MRFRKIIFQKGEFIQQALNEKLEYFHHYWSLVLHTEKIDKALLLQSFKFESHRSLLGKSRIEIESSTEGRLQKAIGNICKLYFNSHLFTKDNLLFRRKPDIQKVLNNIKREFQTSSDYSREEALGKIDELEKIILRGQDEDYASFLAQSLVHIFNKSNRLNNIYEQDIEFLVNALIVELFHVGYSMDFIRKIPDVILFLDSGFPNEVFESRKIPENTDEITLGTRLQGFKALLNRRPAEGYYIFKVDGIDFQLEKSIKIWGNEVYNPQTHSKFSKVDVEDWVYQSWLKSELFYEGKDKSTCNILVPIKYQYQAFDLNKKCLYAAWGKAQDALTVLNEIRNSFDTFKKRHNSSIDIRNRILISSDLHSIESPHHQFNKNEVLRSQIPQSRLIENRLKYLNCLNPVDRLHQKIIDANSLLKRYRNEPWEFKFHELWIRAFESFFPNDLKNIKEFSFKCLVLRYDRNYINYVQSFFYRSLDGDNNPFIKPHHYFSEEERTKLEIAQIEIGKEIIAGDNFKSNFLNISRNLGINVLSKNLQMASDYMDKSSCFIDKLKVWVYSLIEQVYAQRNLYTHSNNIDEFGTMKLKEDIIYLANVVIGEIQSKIYDDFNNPVDEILLDYEKITGTYD